MPLPWLEALPAELPAEQMAGFIDRFCPVSQSLLPYQRAIAEDGADIGILEWDVEQQLIALIKEFFGPVTVLAEEYFGRHRREIGEPGRLRFLLDPLDGTASYRRGSPRLSTSLAVTLDGRSVLALVYEPAAGRLYSALAGHGCYVDGSRLRRRAGTTRIVVVKRQWAAKVPELAERVRLLADRGYRVESMEATALKLCWIAQGRRAGLLKWLSEVNGTVLEWGTTAGVLVCAEAGMRARRLDGSQWSGHQGGMLIGDDQYVKDVGTG
jgi:myo-inositol-1(or 4)-monophosphatase